MKLTLKANYREELNTDRLVLKPWQTEFASGMYKNWATDKDVVKYLSWEPHKNVEETTQIVQMWMGEANYNWYIIEKSTNEPVGSINGREKLGLEHLENLPQTLTSAGKESNTDFRECLSLTRQHCILTVLPDELAQKCILININ